MEVIALVGYGLAAVLFCLLGLLLLTVWRKPGSSPLLLAAVWLSTVWATLLALQAAGGVAVSELVWAMELLRPQAWLLFLVSLILPLAKGSPRYTRLLLLLRNGSLLLSAALLLTLAGERWPDLTEWVPVEWRLVGQLLLAVAGLMLVEQLFRNSPLEHRWTVKYLCFGLGSLFAYDFYLYTDALLFQRLDPTIWAARGPVNALMVPLIGISAARNPRLQLDLFVSRRVVFHTTALLTAGAYMLVMALAGYYIRLWGGEWGTVLQIVFLFGAAVVLLAMLFSGHLRARVKVFFNKHFFSYRYDYREEWLRLIGTLSGQQSSKPLPDRVIWALGEMVDSPGGLLWTREERSSAYRCVAQLGHQQLPTALVGEADPLIDFMRQRYWIVNLKEYAEHPEQYHGLVLPTWLDEVNAPWLVVPLMHDEQVQGFVVLLEPRAPQPLNWENLDLLKTAGRQAASYLALSDAAEALAEARQFEGFNRLSAFVIHDLKNLIAQLSLVASNAKRHRHNPEFFDDAMKTIDNAVTKMNRLMVQLKSAEGLTPTRSRVDLVALLTELVAARQGSRPAPQILIETDKAEVMAEEDRLVAVIGHVIQNAQDATPPDGEVEVGLRLRGDQAIVTVRDTGTGMDQEFIDQRLFRPFDSTKGLTGMGIGAYECREFVRALGGQVDVTSTPGKGTYFTIIMPLASG
jgi:putative PEP-CTERM system histidine kinase